MRNGGEEDMFDRLKRMFEEEEAGGWVTACCNPEACVRMCFIPLGECCDMMICKGLLNAKACVEFTKYILSMIGAV